MNQKLKATSFPDSMTLQQKNAQRHLPERFDHKMLHDAAGINRNVLLFHSISALVRVLLDPFRIKTVSRLPSFTLWRSRVQLEGKFSSVVMPTALCFAAQGWASWPTKCFLFTEKLLQLLHSNCTSELIWRLLLSVSLPWWSKQAKPSGLSSFHH